MNCGLVVLDEDVGTWGNAWWLEVHALREEFEREVVMQEMRHVFQLRSNMV